jgi:hypothetical protein
MHQINLIIRTSLDKNKKFNLFLGKILILTQIFILKKLSLALKYI